ncbi:GIY-YIG nuclease family protein [Myxococcaceae bacterium JPH2]|nr:GIY-YIG nuclease family protein [Myxococcaceae bacterium JPH2]
MLDTQAAPGGGVRVADRVPRPVPRESPGWTVYMLRCRDGTLYTGATNDLPRRVATHAKGRGAAYTRARLPVTLVWSEPAKDRSAALRREAAIKRLTRADKLLLLPPRARKP